MSQFNLDQIMADPETVDAMTVQALGEYQARNIRLKSALGLAYQEIHRLEAELEELRPTDQTEAAEVGSLAEPKVPPRRR